MSLGSALSRDMLAAQGLPTTHDKLGVDRRCYDRSRGFVRWEHTEATATARVTITDGRRYTVFWIRRSLTDAGPLRQQRIHRTYACAATGDTADVVENIDEATTAEIRRVLLDHPLPERLRWLDGWTSLEVVAPEPPAWAGPQLPVEGSGAAHAAESELAAAIQHAAGMHGTTEAERRELAGAALRRAGGVAR